MEVEYLDLGTANYHEVWERQTALMETVKRDRSENRAAVNYLVFVEHPHVYTLGRNGNQSNMLISDSQLAANGVECIRVNRGGDVTYHGPGQLVVYPIFCLTDFRIGIKEYVRRLEEVVIRTIAEYGLRGERMDKATGVWLDVGAPHARKICAIGLRCSQSVTMHGFALNVNTDLSYFNAINPCGFVDRGVTSIEKETGARVNINEIKLFVLQYFKDVFAIDVRNNLFVY
jgi:lipoyl(octanoyl) transferase